MKSKNGQVSFPLRKLKQVAGSDLLNDFPKGNQELSVRTQNEFQLVSCHSCAFYISAIFPPLKKNRGRSFLQVLLLNKMSEPGSITVYFRLQVI